MKTTPILDLRTWELPWQDTEFRGKPHEFRCVAKNLVSFLSKNTSLGLHCPTSDLVGPPLV